VVTGNGTQRRESLEDTKAGERESKSLASVENRAKESAPAHRTPPCAGERASPPRARTEGEQPRGEPQYRVRTWKESTGA